MSCALLFDWISVDFGVRRDAESVEILGDIRRRTYSLVPRTRTSVTRGVKGLRNPKRFSSFPIL